MVKGRGLENIRNDLRTILKYKHDYIAPAKRTIMSPSGLIKIPSQGEFLPTRHALNQICGNYNIPAKYKDKMITNDMIDLLATNVNAWLSISDQKRFIRTVDAPYEDALGDDNARGRLVAWVSDSYRPLDNYDLIEAIYPTLSSLNLRVVSADLTETKLYIKAICSDLRQEVKEGDVVEAGIVISNSEVGDGAVRISDFIHRLVCSNGMIQKQAIRRHHVGKKIGDFSEDISKYITDETREMEDATFWNKVKDTVKGMLTEEHFTEIVEGMKETTEVKLKGKIDDVVEVTKKRYDIGETIGEEVKENLIRSSDFTVWGLANAVTQTANSLEENYEAATRLEEIGGDIITLPNKAMLTIASGKL